MISMNVHEEALIIICYMVYILDSIIVLISIFSFQNIARILIGLISLLATGSLSILAVVLNNHNFTINHFIFVHGIYFS